MSNKSPAFLRARPSLPSLVSRSSARGQTVSSSELFTSTPADISSDSHSLETSTKGKEREEVATPSEDADDPRALLRLQLSRLKRQSSAYSLATSSGQRSRAASTIRGHDEQAISVPAVDGIRRYYILSSAGKPVYTSDESEDEEETTSRVAVMQALISIFASQTPSSRIRTIDAGSVRISFLLRSPLYYVVVSPFAEPDSILRAHLDYLHLHILSVVSLAQLTGMFQQRSNYDLRRLLQGTDAILGSLIRKLSAGFAPLMGALEVLKCGKDVRDEVGKLIGQPPDGKGKPDVLYAVVVAGGRVVTLLRPKRHSVHPSDLHLLLNTVHSSPSLITPGSETWIPICLPRFNASGFLHALVSFITKDVGLIFVSSDKEGFFDMQAWKSAVVDRLNGASSAKLMLKLESAVAKKDYSSGDLSVPGLRHFVYKSRESVQVTSPIWDGIYEDQGSKEQLMSLYYKIYDELHLQPPKYGAGRQPVKLVYLRTQNESVIGWVSTSFELYIALAPLLPKNAAVAAAHAVIRWIKSNESELFLTSAPSF